MVSVISNSAIIIADMMELWKSLLMLGAKKAVSLYGRKGDWEESLIEIIFNFFSLISLR